MQRVADRMNGGVQYVGDRARGRRHSVLRPKLNAPAKVRIGVEAHDLNLLAECGRQHTARRPLAEGAKWQSQNSSQGKSFRGCR